MFCTNCGAKLQENAKFCIYCGHPVEMDETVPPQVAQSTQPIPQPTESEPPVQTEDAPASTEQPEESTQQPAESEASEQIEEVPASTEQPEASTPQPAESAAPEPTEETPASAGQPEESMPQPAESKTAVETLEAPRESDLDLEWEEEDELEEDIPLARRLLPLWIGLGTVALTAVAFAVIQFAPIGQQAQADGSAVASSSSSVSEPGETDNQETDDDTQTPDASEEVTPPAEEEEPTIVEEFRVSSVMTNEIREQGGKYINHRFDYTLAVPDGFVASNEFQGGDGLRLYSAEYDMRITVYSGYQTSKTTEELFNQACAEIPGTLGYNAYGEDWYAVSSGDEEGMVHYRKYGAWDDKYRVMELIYPKANEEVCDPLTEELEDGFVSGTPD
ncbi:zinc ribbon domain-containing protein [Intestinibacillus sp. Marseille-P6563]|uniref:zinc ribbon domain-containing protein n=1 Tax=Intestinibacillus sp. Marseille-P6563 TaxID=2364792 RepID=UPI000F0678F0|nr:zinc ribbon domain-containing protein [Intestinibacillus sp. Marseille-P6563]